MSTALTDVLPGVSATAVSAVDNYQWNTWSPRIGVTWDINGTGKTVLKLALSQYGDVMGTGYNSASPLGTGGTARFWWNDGANGNPARHVVQFGEMYWNYWSGGANPYGVYRLFNDDGSYTAEATAALVGGSSSNARLAGNYSGYDWANKTGLDYSNITTYFFNNSVKSSTRTSEILLTLERELMADFSAQINLTYRKYDNFDTSWQYFPDSIYGEDYPEWAGHGHRRPERPLVRRSRHDPRRGGDRRHVGDFHLLQHGRRGRAALLSAQRRLSGPALGILDGQEEQCLQHLYGH